MKKINLLVITFLLLISYCLLPVSSYAVSSSVSVKIEEPKTPTNDNEFKITFVALDIQNRPITVKCFKKSPSDAGFAQFGSDIVLSNGGNTSNCHVSSSLISAIGTYQFYVEAKAEGDTVTSSTVSVNYKNSIPQTPVNYSKERIGCDYKIKFKTADDNNATKKVEIYMSTSKSFPADNGTRIAEIGIGSNTEGSHTQGTDCDKTYYFVIRAFDDAGNGSGVIGDSEVTTTTTTITKAGPVAQTQGAIPAQSSQAEGVLGESEADASQSSEISTESAEEVLGTESASADSKEDQAEDKSFWETDGLFSPKILLFVLIAAVAAGGGFYFYRKIK